jgi:hypothetical protein
MHGRQPPGKKMHHRCSARHGRLFSHLRHGHLEIKGRHESRAEDVRCEWLRVRDGEDVPSGIASDGRMGGVGTA